MENLIVHKNYGLVRAKTAKVIFTARPKKDFLRFSEKLVWVERYFPKTLWDFLSYFKNQGYQTSYYLPWPGLSHLKNDSLNSLLYHIQDKIDANDLNEISSNYHDYDIMNKSIPKNDKLLWKTGTKTEYSNNIQEFLYQLLKLQDSRLPRISPWWRSIQ